FDTLLGEIETTSAGSAAAGAVEAALTAAVLVPSLNLTSPMSAVPADRTQDPDCVTAPITLAPAAIAVLTVTFHVPDCVTAWVATVRVPASVLAICESHPT